MPINLLLATNYFVFSNVDTNFARTFALWLTISLAIGIALSFLVTKEENRSAFFKTVIPIILTYSVTVASLFLYFNYKSDGIVKLLFIPLLILILVSFVSAIILCFNRSKGVVLAVSAMFLVAFLATLVCMLTYFNSGSAEEYNYVSIEKIENIMLYVGTALVIAVIAILMLIIGKHDKKGFDSKSISFGAICIAMSFALSYVRILKLPQGGSITIASLMPIMLYSYMFGVKKGVFVGFVYGILQAVGDPYIVHPMQFMLDYPVAFASIGLSGMFAKMNAIKKPQLQIAFGAVFASLLRYISHVISGVFAFSEYAPQGQNTLIYSLGYNSFVFADIAVCILVCLLIFSSKSFLRQIQKYNND